MKTKYPHIESASRGLFVTESKTSEKSLSIIKKNGLILPDKPSALSHEEIDDALLLVMGERHKQMILSMNPEANVYLLSEYAAGEQRDILDPFGGTLEQYEAVYNEMKFYLEKIEL